MTVFYHGPCARITHEVFETRTPNYQLFPIRDLAGIHLVRETDRSIMATPWARAGSTALVLAAIIAGARAGLHVLRRVRSSNGSEVIDNRVGVPAGR